MPTIQFAVYLDKEAYAEYQEHKEEINRLARAYAKQLIEAHKGRIPAHESVGDA